MTHQPVSCKPTARREHHAPLSTPWRVSRAQLNKPAIVLRSLVQSVKKLANLPKPEILELLRSNPVHLQSERARCEAGQLVEESLMAGFQNIFHALFVELGQGAGCALAVLQCQVFAPLDDFHQVRYADMSLVFAVTMVSVVVVVVIVWMVLFQTWGAFQESVGETLVVFCDHLKTHKGPG